MPLAAASPFAATTVTVRTSEALCERSMGSWEKVDRRTVPSQEFEVRQLLVARQSRALFVFQVDPWQFRPPGISQSDGTAGESFRDVETRMSNFINHLLEKPKLSSESQVSDHQQVALFV